jgi:hypothetical protein
VPELNIKIPEEFITSMQRFTDSLKKYVELTAKIQQAANENAQAPEQVAPGLMNKFHNLKQMFNSVESTVQRSVDRIAQRLGPAARAFLSRLAGTLPAKLASFDVSNIIRYAGMAQFTRFLPGVATGPLVVVAIVKWIWDKSYELANAIRSDFLTARAVGTTVGGLQAFRIGFGMLPDIEQVIGGTMRATTDITSQQLRAFRLLGIDPNRVAPDVNFEVRHQINTLPEMLSIILTAQRWAKAQRGDLMLFLAERLRITSIISLLLALPEHKVPLPGSSRGDSQSDLFAIIRAADKTFAVTIEGKVDEPFDRPLSEWLADASCGKRKRLAFICDLLGLEPPLPSNIYYQLLQRTAAAVIEARRFKTDAAVMIVHSFSRTRKWYHAFEHFVSLFGIAPKPSHLLPVRPQGDPPL